MRVLFIKPPFVLSGRHSLNLGDIPIGLLYVAAATEKTGHEVAIYDGYLNQLEEGYEVAWEKMKEKLKLFGPEVVGISNQYSTQVQAAYRSAELAKSVIPKATVVVGGPHSSVVPESLLKECRAVDIAFLGEGEERFPVLLEHLEQRTAIDDFPGIAFHRGDGLKINNKFEFIRKLDNLPLPAYHLIPLEKYFYVETRPTFKYLGSGRAISLITSRGCPYRCTFCSIHLTMGRQWRSHSPEHVITHLEYLIKHYGIRHVHFEDDNFTLSKERTKRIFHLVEEHGLAFTWDTPNGIRLDILDQEILEVFKRNRCVYLAFGIESGCQDTLNKIIKKRLDLKVVKEVVETAHRVGLDTRAFFVIGFPGESVRSMKQTVSFALRLALRYGLWPYMLIATPLWGTKLYNICRENNYLVRAMTSENLERNYECGGMIETDEFKTSDLVRIKNKLHRNHRLIRYLRLPGCLTNHRVLRYVVQKCFKKPRNVKETLSEAVIFRNFIINNYDLLTELRMLNGCEKFGEKR